MPVADKKILFLRLVKVYNCDFFGVNDNFESERIENKWCILAGIM